MTTGDELHAIATRLGEAAPPHVTLLSCGSITLRVSSTSPGPLTALTAAVTPYLKPARADLDRAHPDLIEQIGIHTDPVLADRLHLLAERPGGLTHRVRLVRACAGAGERYREVSLLWDQATPHTSHLVLGRPGSATDKVTLRLVRGIAGRRLITAGWVPLHAAAALTQAGLIVLAGHSGAGKTTALLELLANRLGRAFVTNDKVYLTINSDGVHARALPTSLALRPDTTAMFPALSDLGAYAALTHVDNHPGRTGADRRILIPPRRLADAFGVPLHPGGLVAGILAISYDGTGRPSRWRRMGPTRAVDAVTTGYLNDWFIDEHHEHSRLGMPSTPLRCAHHNALRRIAAAVPLIKLNAGTDTPQALHSIITGLAGSADHTERARGQ